MDDRFITPDGTYYNYADYTAEGNYDTVFCAPGGGCFPFQVLPGDFPDERRNDVDGWGLSGRVNFDISDSLTLTSITAYRHAEGTSVIDIDGTPLNALKQRLGYEHEQFTQELRLSGQFGDAADFTIGGFYYDANGVMDFRNQIPIFLYDFETDDQVSSTSIAAFAHLEVHATDRLNIIGGVRYTDDKKTYLFSRLNPDNSAIPLPTSPTDTYLNVLVASLDGLTGVYEGSRVDYRLGVNFNWSDDVMTYAQVSTGYKGGGVNPRPFVADQVTSFDPEDLLTVEAGLKSVLLDGALTFNAAAFYNDYKDIQRTVYVCLDSVSRSCAKALNAGDGHSYGVEFEATVRPGDGWLLAGSLSLLDFKYDTINPLTGITLDMEAPFHGDVTASGSIQYTADLGDSGTLTPRLDVSYQSSYYYQAINNPPFNLVEGRALANAGITYETADGNWQLRARVSNLFDKYYYVIAGENINTFGFANAVVGRPREWSLSVRREF